MNKGDLVAEVHKRVRAEWEDREAPEPSRAQVGRIVDLLLEVVREEVARGSRVTLAGFGTFQSQRRAARLARNPRTGEAVKVPPTTAPSFRPGKAFREAVVPRRRKAATRPKAAGRRR